MPPEAVMPVLAWMLFVGLFNEKSPTEDPVTVPTSNGPPGWVTAPLAIRFRVPARPVRFTVPSSRIALAVVVKPRAAPGGLVKPPTSSVPLATPMSASSPVPMGATPAAAVPARLTVSAENGASSMVPAAAPMEPATSAVRLSAIREIRPEAALVNDAGAVPPMVRLAPAAATSNRSVPL